MSAPATASGSTFERRNPAKPSEVLGPFPDSGPADVEAAARAADAAFPAWARRPAAERAAILDAAARLAHERAEAIAQAITLETGKPLREARGEAARVATTLRYFAADASLQQGELYTQSATAGHVYTRRRPLGVVALITPWNFPVAIPAWKAAPALVAGNTVVLKPSVHTQPRDRPPVHGRGASGGHPRQLAHHRGGGLRPLRRHQGVGMGSTRAGPRGSRLLHPDRDCLRGRLTARWRIST